MRILIDLQPLQTPGAAKRGVGRFTGGLLQALASAHEVVGLRRAVPYVVPPKVDVPTIEIQPGLPSSDLEPLISAHDFDVVVNCSGPFWEENFIVANLRSPQRPFVASIFYDVIPWIYPNPYLQTSRFRCAYHNRCVDLYARADLVCAISHQSKCDALRFGYATDETATTISVGVEPPVAEVTDARKKWQIPMPYVLSVSGDDFRKNPEMLIAAFLHSRMRKSRCLIVIVSNDADSGFSARMKAKFGNLKTRGVIILPGVTEGELGALYRDCDALIYTSLYEGFGIPLIEAMQFGKWVISPRSSSFAEVSGPALLASIEDAGNLNSITLALDEADKRLEQRGLDESVPRHHAQNFSWEQVVQNFQSAVTRRRGVMAMRSPVLTRDRPRLFWASPFPTDVSGIAFYSEDLIGHIGNHYDVTLVPNTVSTFIPTVKTGRFKMVEPNPEALLALTNDQLPLVIYNIGNSQFHLALLELLFALPGIVVLHDSFVGGLETLWRERIAAPATALGFSTSPSMSRVHRWCIKLGKIDRLFLPFQRTRLRRALGMIAALPGMSWLGSRLARFFQWCSGAIEARYVAAEVRLIADSRPLVLRIIESSRAMLFLVEHAKSLIATEQLAGRQTQVVPLYCRYRGAISPTQKAELRRQYAIPQDAFVVTTTGFQSNLKLTDQLIRSCMDLDRAEANALVYVQVLGEFADPTFEDHVRDLFESSGLKGFISGAFLDEPTLTDRMALGDVAVFLRGWSTGGQSAALNDALGMGIPSLVTDDFAFKEYPETAVMHVPNNGVTEGLVRLYRNQKMSQAFAAGGLQYAKLTSADRIATRLVEIFSSYEGARIRRGRVDEARRSGEKALPYVFVDLTYGLMQKVRSGLQRVEREIASGLRELDADGEYFGFVAWDRRFRCFRLVSLEHLKERETLPSTEAWLTKCPQALIDNQANFFALSLGWPLGNDYFADLVGLARRGVTLSVLLPDLIPFRQRWTFYGDHPKGSEIDLFEEFCKQVVPECGKILTISNYAMGDIQKMLMEIGDGENSKKKMPKIHVLRLGADWRTPFLDARPGHTLVKRGRLVENPYILYVSTLDVRKNHGRLLEAFTKVRKQVNDLDLVLVGRADGSIAAATRQSINRSPWVHHFASLDDSTLRRLYEDCLFTVFPSLDEGFGLPVIESFKYGKFCLASEAEAIPEAGGEFADYFNPRDVQMLAEKILMYVSDREALQRRERLLAEYRPTSWSETVRQVAQIFYGDRAERLFMSREEG